VVEDLDDLRGALVMALDEMQVVNWEEIEKRNRLVTSYRGSR
jgi:hypothetical protein